MSDTGIDLLLAFADDEHLMGQQHTEWIGVAPFLEEDLAFSSIGQDELGHAVMLYEHVLAARGVEATDASVDHLAYRDAEDYRSCALAEYVTTDWAEALVRHWLYDTAEAMRWEQLAHSSDPGLRDLAATAARDEAFHRRHADALLDRLLGDQVARDRIVIALHALTPLLGSLVTPTSDTDEAIANGLVDGSLADLAAPLAIKISDRFGVATPEVAPANSARTERSEHFAPLMTRMREVLDIDANAVW
ncbi:MAG: 1,2-phenylacetyl-CoA epoxidase subunit PaaC [Ilumatobacter sp.]